MTSATTATSQPAHLGTKRGNSPERNERERFYRAIVDSLDEATHVVDRNLRIVCISCHFRRWRTLVGSASHLVGVPLLKAFPFLPRRVAAEYRKVLRSGQTLITEETLEVRGKALTVSVRKVPLWEGREVTHVLTLVADITARKKADRDLRENEEKFRLIAETSLVGIAMAQKGSLVYANRRFHSMFGYPDGELVGRDMFCIVAPEDLGTMREKRRRRLRSETAAPTYVFKAIRKDGTRLDVEVASGVARAIGGVPTILAVMVDVTERRRAEEALWASEEQYRLLAENAPDFIYIISPDMRIRYVNPAGARLWRKSADALVGRALKDIFPPQVVPRMQRNLRKVLRTGRVLYLEQDYPLRSGTLWMSAKLAPIRDKKGRTIGVLGISRDITGKQRAYEALRESESRYRMLAEQSEEAIIIAGTNGRIALVNRRACELLGYRRERIERRRVHDFFAEEDLSPLRLDAKAIESGALVTKIRRARRADGTFIPVETRSKMIPGNQVLGYWRDISEQVRRDSELKAIARQERRDIGHALHDSLGQELMGLKFLTTVLARKLDARSIPEAAEARQIVGLAGHALLQSRRIAHGLADFGEKGQDLPTALRRLAEGTRELFGVDCRFRGPGSETVFDSDIVIHLHHIAMEAVNNVIRHADAKHIAIRLTIGKTRGRLVVEDDGRGISRSAGAKPGMGLRVMRYRASLIGGSLEVRRNGPRGTRVTCTFRRSLT